MKKWCGLVAILLLSLFTDVAESDLKTQAQEALQMCRLALQRPCPDPRIKFNLYTRQNVAGSHKVHVTRLRDNLDKTFFNSSHPNKVIIHGLSPLPFKADLVSIKDAYLSREETNVWMVDWSVLAEGGQCAMMSLKNADHVADCTAQLIAAIERRTPEADIHVVAERAGVRVAHKLASVISPQRLNRITGLNPEKGIVMTGFDPNRLDSQDADCVDIIHTSPYLPHSKPFGHIDFYANPNRMHQPGCEKEESGKFACDDSRALQYFAESITTTVGFQGWQCKDFASFALGTCHPDPQLQTMGESCSGGASGIHIVFTNKEKPYALGHWEEQLYQEKGPKLRTDAVSRYSTTIKRKVEEINEKTPELLKETGVVDHVKSKLDVGEDFGTTITKWSIRGAKILANRMMEKHNEKPGINLVKKIANLAGRK